MQTTKQLNVSLALILAIAPAHTLASEADYQVEMGFGQLQADYDNTIKQSDTINLLSLEYYLIPVKIDKQPLAEAAFMTRSGSLALALAQNDIEANNASGDGNLTLFLYTHMQSDSALRLQLLYIKASTDVRFKPGYNFINYNYDTTTTGFSIGGFTAQNTALSLEYLKQDRTFAPAAYTNNNVTLTSTNLVAKHLMPGDNGTMVNIEALLGFDNYDNATGADTKNTVLEVTADYYLNNRQSIGATFKKISGDDNEEKGQAVAVHGRFFVTEKVSFDAEIYQFSGEGQSIDSDQLTINANVRF